MYRKLFAGLHASLRWIQQCLPFLLFQESELLCSTFRDFEAYLRPVLVCLTLTFQPLYCVAMPGLDTCRARIARSQRRLTSCCCALILLDHDNKKGHIRNKITHFFGLWHLMVLTKQKSASNVLILFPFYMLKQPSLIAEFNVNIPMETKTVRSWKILARLWRQT